MEKTVYFHEFYKLNIDLIIHGRGNIKHALRERLRIKAKNMKEYRERKLKRRQDEVNWIYKSSKNKSYAFLTNKNATGGGLKLMLSLNIKTLII